MQVGPTREKLTHSLQYQQRDGSWRDGFLAYTLGEAKGCAKVARRERSCKVRIVEISSGRVVR